MRKLFLHLAAVTLVAAPVYADVFELPPEGYDVIGSVSTVTASYEDTLVDIARRHGLGYYDVVHANPGVDIWVPGNGTEIILPGRFILPPGPREGLVLNLAERCPVLAPRVVMNLVDLGLLQLRLAGGRPAGKGAQRRYRIRHHHPQ